MSEDVVMVDDDGGEHNNIEDDGGETPRKSRAAGKRPAVQSPASDDNQPALNRQRIDDPVCGSLMILQQF
jgi:hypothetical protein